MTPWLDPFPQFMSFFYSPRSRFSVFAAKQNKVKTLRSRRPGPKLGMFSGGFTSCPAATQGRRGAPGDSLRIAGWHGELSPDNSAKHSAENSGVPSGDDSCASCERQVKRLVEKELQVQGKCPGNTPPPYRKREIASTSWHW